jgi:hypothetical protein
MLLLNVTIQNHYLIYKNKTIIYCKKAVLLSMQIFIIR